MSVWVLREKLGQEGMAGLDEVLSHAGKRWKDDVLEQLVQRVERRLAEEIGAVRVDMAREFGAMRTEMAREFAAVRTEMADIKLAVAEHHTSLLKWLLLLWISQAAMTAGYMGFLLRAIENQ